jgi:glyoxylase-like metal-dependent hydrolase (beta-lactamase superfamily II)
VRARATAPPFDCRSLTDLRTDGIAMLRTLLLRVVSEMRRRRAVGRGERVLPGVWRLRVPVTLPGVPHVNAWALAAGDGIVLVDTGRHEAGSLGHLERALEQVGLRIEHVRLIVCTHAHTDHCGQAASIIDRTGCELWMHPDHDHLRRGIEDPDAVLEQRLQVGLQSGVPEEPLRRFLEKSRDVESGVARYVPPSRALVPGVEIETDLGTWTVHETPGHAPSHVCLHQAERRLLISGDHVLGRVSIYYDPADPGDPVGAYLRSLDIVERLDARLALPGHGRTFTDVRGHIAAHRQSVHEELGRVRAGLRDEPATAFELAVRVYGPPPSPVVATLRLARTLCYLRHLEAIGDAERSVAGDGEPERWRLRGARLSTVA